jgi:hypothetical protein
MTTTISGTSVTFFDGSSFNGTYAGAENQSLGPLATQTDATSEFASAYNIGTLLFAVNFFYSGNSPTGPGGSPLSMWGLNQTATNYGQATPVSASGYYSEDYLKPKMVFANGGVGNALAGTWKGRGNAYNRGSQFFLNITMIERIA